MILQDFSGSKILCIGDIILDSYIKGSVNRISPEAPIPVFKLQSESFVLGGAANVARNVVSGGGKCHLISVVGRDKESDILRGIIKKTNNLSVDLVLDKRITTIKKRYFSGQQQLLRVDNEVDSSVSKNCEQKIFKLFEKKVKETDVIILSDYNKGLLTKNLVKKIIFLANKLNKITIVDPKKKSFDFYSGARILTPNLNELLEATNSSIENLKVEDELIKSLSLGLIKKYNFSSIITTRSSNGMTIVSKNGKFNNLSSKALEVYDVSGAGDTVVAYLSLALSKNINLIESAKIANEAAGISVGKLGTACVYKEEVFGPRSSEKKIVSLKDAKSKLGKLRLHNKIGFTNGCFDLIHSGHVGYLKKSKSLCDFLILGLNSDKSIKKLKGNDRPIFNLDERLKLLSNFDFIDLIVVFEDLTPIKLIKTLKPNIIFKGKDYKLQEVVGYNEIQNWNGKVILVDYEKGKSTSNFIQRIKNGT